MNKADLITCIADEVGITKTDAERCLNSLTTNIMKACKKGDRVSLVGFGTFLCVKRKARTGRNPQTGRTLKIPACKVPKFRAGKFFKQTVRKK